MRRLVLTFVLSFIVNVSFACLSASQNRLFPIGICSKGLVVVEVHLYRGDSTDGKTEKLHPVWRGLSYLKIYDKLYKTIDSKLIDTLKRFSGNTYIEVIKRTYTKGLELTKKIPDLQYAEPQSISFCNYELKCTNAALITDTINNRACVILDSGKQQEITVLYDSSSIASNYLSFYNSFDYEADESKMKSVVQGLLINSVRKFKIGDKNLAIIHFGTGQKFGENLKYNNHIPFDKNNNIFIEPVLHHGHGFDYFIIN